MNLINVSFFFAVQWSFFPLIAFCHLILLDVSKSFRLSLSCVVPHPLSRCFFLLLCCLHLIFVLYSSDSVETYSFMLCAMFILFMMRVCFIYSIFLVWRSTNTNCEYFMKGKSSFRIKLLFCDSILKLYVSECVHADVRISRSFYLESEGFSKTILFAFWIPFFLLLLSFIWILVQFFFSSFNLEE